MRSALWSLGHVPAGALRLRLALASILGLPSPHTFRNVLAQSLADLKSASRLRSFEVAYGQIAARVGLIHALMSMF